MNITYSPFMRCLLPLFRLFQVLVPYKGTDIPVTVNFRSKIDSANFYMERKFHFPSIKPYDFYSHMTAPPQHDAPHDELIEVMRFDIGWRMRFFYDGKKVVMQHKGFVLQIRGKAIPLPLELFLGKGYAEEEAIDDNNFRMSMTMTHPLFGLMYRYAGTFTFKRS